MTNNGQQGNFQAGGPGDAGAVQAGPPRDPLIGYVVAGKYQIVESLGRGGMSMVYKGRHVTVERIVAIKTLASKNVEALKRFEQEVRVHGRLNHRNIVHVYDCLVEPNGRPFFVMEYLKGQSLERLLQLRGGVKDEQIIKTIFGQLCDAVEYAHEKGVLHRDIKPGNIVIDEKDGAFTVKVVDFGLAQVQEELRHSSTTQFVQGSPVYMSPEQCMGQPMDTRSDIYSLGVVLYQLITGAVPYDEATVYEMMAAHCDQIRKPDPVAYRQRMLKGARLIDAIIGSCLESEPAKRIESVTTLKKALDTWYECMEKGETEDISVLFKYIYPDMVFEEEIVEEEPEPPPVLETEQSWDPTMGAQELESLVKKAQQTKAELIAKRTPPTGAETIRELSNHKGLLILFAVLLVVAIFCFTHLGG